MEIINKPYNINIDIGIGLSEPVVFINYKCSMKLECDKLTISIGNNKLTENNIIIDIFNTNEPFIILDMIYIYSYIFIYIHNKSIDIYKKIYKLPSINITNIDENIDIVLYKNRYELEQTISKVINKLKDTNYPDKDILFNKLNNIKINELDNQRILILLENLNTRYNL